MSRILSILLLAAPLLHAQVSKPDVKKNPISLLPDGSILEGVLLPRYDEQRRLVGDLRTEILTLIDPKRIKGENVTIQFYNPDTTLQAKIQLQKAFFDAEKSILRANQPVEITSDRLTANGQGLLYEFQNGEGFLLGPVTTRISAPPKETSMKTRPLHTAALYAMCIAPTLLHAEPPAFATKEEIQAIEADAITRKPTLDAANQSAATSLATTTEASETASAAALAFTTAAGIKPIATPPTDREKAQPLQIKPSPDDTVITCEGGMYFDAEEGVLVYLGNVRVTDPRFGLTGANELKIFFAKKTNTGAEPEKNTSSIAAAGADFGNVTRLVAEGTVVIDQKPIDGKDPIKASGRVLTYNVAAGEILIHGGYPWVQQGAFFARAKQANLTLRLLTSGSFSTEGNWEMGGNLKLNR